MNAGLGTCAPCSGRYPFLSLLLYNSPVLATELVMGMTMEMVMGMVMEMGMGMGIGEKEQAKKIAMMMMVMGMVTMKAMVRLRRTIMDGSLL